MMATDNTKNVEKEILTITTITKKDMKDVQKQLKKFKGFWMEDMVKELNKARRSKEINYSKEFTASTVYNVFNGVIKNQLVKALVLTKAKALLERYQEKVSEAVS
jgi:hypothetical protein